MGEKYQQIVTRISKFRKALEKDHPEFSQNFHALVPSAFKPGALDTKTKELICVGIGVASRCDCCIAVHTRASLKAGATRQEIIEMLGVAILMGGGNSYAYAAHVMEAVEEFEREKT